MSHGANLKATYSVVLRAGIPTVEAEFYRLFCGTITLDSGGVLLHFYCTRVDVSHHNYIEMQTFLPHKEGRFLLRVPHHYVLMIDGSEERPTIGFRGS